MGDKRPDLPHDEPLAADGHDVVDGVVDPAEIDQSAEPVTE